MEHLTKPAKKGGNIVVGDFSLPSCGIVAKLFQSNYWYIADIIFFVMARNALHPVYDHQSYMQQF
ncbi:MAG: hypothetical protein JXM72_08180 [Deltaproteobacteria bacterium]|nr:hypothetical protein [Deltaproteobacteria bacterium]